MFNKIIFLFLFLYSSAFSVCAPCAPCICTPILSAKLSTLRLKVNMKFTNFANSLNKEIGLLGELNQILTTGESEEKKTISAFSYKELMLEQIIFELEKHSKLINIESQVDILLVKKTKENKK